jgi:hypothetical protein
MFDNRSSVGLPYIRVQCCTIWNAVLGKSTLSLKAVFEFDPWFNAVEAIVEWKKTGDDR